MQKSASVLRKWIESQDPFRLYPSAFNPKDYRIPMETGVSRKIILRVWASGTTAYRVNWLTSSAQSSNQDWPLYTGNSFSSTRPSISCEDNVPKRKIVISPTLMYMESLSFLEWAYKCIAGMIIQICVSVESLEWTVELIVWLPIGLQLWSKRRGAMVWRNDFLFL